MKTDTKTENKIALVNIAEYSDIKQWPSYEKDLSFLDENSIPFKDFASGRDTHSLLLEGFYNALNDPEISVIWFVNGGSKFIEFLNELDWEQIKNKNKVFLGLSDFTHFSILANQNKIKTYYGLALKKITEYHSDAMRKEIATTLKQLILRDSGDNQSEILFQENKITGGHLGITIFMIGGFNIKLNGKTLFFEHHYIPGESIEDLIYFVHQLAFLLKENNNIPYSFLLGHSVLFDHGDMIDFSLINMNIEKVLKIYFPEIEVKTLDHFKYIIEMK